jgi:dTDP-4-dehydrorhamnose reductase
MTILVLGASGMLGNAIFRILSEHGDATVLGTVRSTKTNQFFIPVLASRLLVTENLEDLDALELLFEQVKPQVVVNCVALKKSDLSDPMKSISVFSLLPRRLASLCRRANARLVLISSDGVFSGTRGRYTEYDLPDANDLYGIAKLLGEVSEPNVITLRTSIIGHELQGKDGLLEWFLSQGNQCRCYTKAIFSGFPTVVLAQVIRDVILPRPNLQGIYHVATQPISKFDLLQLVAQRYGKCVAIVPDDKIAIDRSLSAELFTKATGYVPPPWPELINSMYSYQYGLERRYV